MLSPWEVAFAETCRGSGEGALDMVYVVVQERGRGRMLARSQ